MGFHLLNTFNSFLNCSFSLTNLINSSHSQYNILSSLSEIFNVVYVSIDVPILASIPPAA